MKKWKPGRSLRANLRRSMPALVNDWFEAGRYAMGPGRTWEEIHHFRLLTKRFRYTLEIFSDAYGPAVQQRIAELKQLQTLLGELNDSVVTEIGLAELPATEKIRAELASRTERRKRKLTEFWATTFAIPGRQTRWSTYLTAYACRKKPMVVRRGAPAAKIVEKSTESA